MQNQLETPHAPIMQSVLGQLDFDPETATIIIQSLERNHGNPALSGRSLWITLPDERYRGDDRKTADAALIYLRHRNKGQRYRSVLLTAKVIDE